MFEYVDPKFQRSTAKLYVFDDTEEQKAYKDFIFKFHCQEEGERRGASHCKLFELGYANHGIDTERPVVVYFDKRRRAVSHEIYYGDPTGEIIKRRWQQYITRRKSG